MAKTSGGVRGSSGNAAAEKWAAVLTDSDMRIEAAKAAMIIISKLGIDSRDLPKIREANIKSGRMGATVANFNSNEFGEVITINTNKKAVKIYKDNKATQVTSGWLSQSNTVLHELSHGIHRRLESELIRTPQGYRKSLSIGRLGSDIIKKEVSKYGATNREEFHAELISGILSGRRYSRRILDDSILGKSDNRIAKKLYRMGLKHG